MGREDFILVDLCGHHYYLFFILSPSSINGALIIYYHWLFQLEIWVQLFVSIIINSSTQVILIYWTINRNAQIPKEL